MTVISALHQDLVFNRRVRVLSEALSRLLAAGINVKVFVLDTQVYSNTGGQASTSTFMGQNTKMSVH